MCCLFRVQTVELSLRDLMNNYLKFRVEALLFCYSGCVMHTSFSNFKLLSMFFIFNAVSNLSL